ncbi:pilus assembly PilX N-terminal domain-containing protein [Pseudoalteromonas spongiae]|uniref:pilus assembly PilX N-terminal domain-containing protein n=1 Tax=Pseudoalteromonas spongiae TaxID=298657 RepID=UPI00110B08CF|nr:pilus assembly PilX N-terminal domain-containing protein [Pseudoalteromonas spongiae]TMO85163.1 hypothetical protein CWC15_08065 [Pseudoalteromonas spongiae]
MKKQKGFTLLSVMILTTMTSIIVLSSLRDNFIQERLTGNYQKKMNARLVSEKGIFETHKRVIEELSKNPDATIAELINDTLGENPYITGSAETDNMSYAAQLGVNSDGLLELNSDGKRFEGANNTVALFELVNKGAASAFSSGLIGCEGVTSTAGGRIDAYDSSQGNYARENAIPASATTTIHQDSNVTLSGGASVWGDVSATGDINLSGGATVYGDVHANGNITIDVGPQNGRKSDEMPEGETIYISVSGDVLSNGDVTLAQTQIGGVIRAEKDLTLGNGRLNEVLNRDNNGKDIMYGGILTTLNSLPSQYNQDGLLYTDPTFNVLPNVPTVPSRPPDSEIDENFDTTDPATNCDPIGIDNNMNEYKELGLESLALRSENSIYTLYDRSYTAPSQAPVWGESFPSLSARNEQLPTGESVPMFKVKDLLLNGGALKIAANNDVYLFVDGDFTLTTSGSSKLEIEDGASLTLFVTGKVHIQKGVVQTEGITESGNPVFSIYSSYQGEDGIKVNATGDFYAAIYAPKTDALVKASGSTMGSIRAKTVSIDGAGGFHYDTKLGEIGNVSTCCGATKLVFKGWRYL